MAGDPDFPAHLRVLKQLGRGAYGTVHLCEDVRDNSQVAVKHVKQAARHGKSILREVMLLARLKHENLLNLIDFPAVSGPNFEDVFFVLPYFAADLHRVIQSRQALSEKHVQVIICQILRALAYLHAAGVAHRDLKPANILVAQDCRLKVCDFGLARGDMPNPDDDGGEEEQACGVLTEYVITRWYRAPEVMLLPKNYTSTVDLWSAGCILAEILGRKAIFPGKNHVDMIVRVCEFLGTPSDDDLNWLPRKSDAYRFVRRVCPRSDGIPFGTLYPQASRACLDLLRGLLGWDPARRLTAAEAQEHEYLRNFRPKEKPIPPELFDWSFDGFKPTTSAVKDRLYRECARFHPEMLQRDSPTSTVPPAAAAATSPTEGRRFPPALPPRPRCDVAPPVPALAGAEYARRQQQEQQIGERQRLSGGLAGAEHATRQQQEQQKERQRLLSGGYPPGPPWRVDSRPLSARSSDGYPARNCGFGHQMAPSHSMIPQPHFVARSAHGTPLPGRSLTPQRVLVG